MLWVCSALFAVGRFGDNNSRGWLVLWDTTQASGLHCGGWFWAPFSLPHSLQAEKQQAPLVQSSKSTQLPPPYKRNSPISPQNSSHLATRRSCSHSIPGHPLSWSHRRHGSPSYPVTANVSVMTNQGPETLLVCAYVVSCAPNLSTLLFLCIRLFFCWAHTRSTFLTSWRPFSKVASILGPGLTSLSKPGFPTSFSRWEVSCDRKVLRSLQFPDRTLLRYILLFPNESPGDSWWVPNDLNRNKTEGFATPDISFLFTAFSATVVSQVSIRCRENRE